MKKYISIFFLGLAVLVMSFAPNPVQDNSEFEGAWTTQYQNDQGQQVTVVAILQDGYLAQSFYTKDPNEFIQAVGGVYTIENNVLNVEIRFSSSGEPALGSKSSSEFTREGDKVTMTQSDVIWTRIDRGNNSPLASAWFITGRKRNGELSQNNNIGPRRTMKILSDTRFQWIAYNMETGDFRGTGGGTYTAENGKYTENIEFFSRDNTRVGASLSFDYDVKSKEWHHSGLSSKGNPIYEIWTPVEMVKFSTDD